MVCPRSDPGTGSPPHVRGKELLVGVDFLTTGITPAYAGKSTGAYSMTTLSRGSPPRMRGKVDGFSQNGAIPGITPAYAGKSSVKERTTPRNRDHPRMCGEKATASSMRLMAMGSPPHVRGKVHFILSGHVKLGITPACAGKRRTLCRSCPPIRDHPRMCGEKTAGRSDAGYLAGSPPHVRGKEALELCPAGAAGITPACAGKSSIL